MRPHARGPRRRRDPRRAAAAARARARFPPFHGGESLYFAIPQHRQARRRARPRVPRRIASSSTALLASADVLRRVVRAAGISRRSGSTRRELAERHPQLVIVLAQRLRPDRPLPRLGRHRRGARSGGRHDVQGRRRATSAPLLPPGAIAYDVAGDRRGVRDAGRAAGSAARPGAASRSTCRCCEAVAQTTDWSFSNASGHASTRACRLAEMRKGSGPVYTIYACKGGYVRLVVLSPRQWRAMWEWLGKPEAFADPHWEAFSRAPDERRRAERGSTGALRVDDHGGGVGRGAAPRHRLHAGAAARARCSRTSTSVARQRSSTIGARARPAAVRWRRASTSSTASARASARRAPAPGRAPGRGARRAAHGQRRAGRAGAERLRRRRRSPACACSTSASAASASRRAACSPSTAPT